MEVVCNASATLVERTLDGLIVLLVACCCGRRMSSWDDEFL